jgi:hypothetical protein
MNKMDVGLLKACQPVKPLKVVPLGDASSANCVNTCIYRYHGVVTRGEWQFTAWFIDAQSLIVARRRLADDRLETFTLAGTYNITDAHNSISLGIDADGFLHMAYDHHGHHLHYRRSLQPLDIQGWTDEIPMTGTMEDRVTYPYFLMLPAGPGDRESRGPLLFLYRDRQSGNGDVYLKAYDTESGAWSDRPGPVLKGTGQEPWTTNAYWNAPAIEPNGAIHLTFTWRINNIYGDGGRWFNKDIGYLKTDDLGLTWKAQSGDRLPLPVTPSIAEVIWPIPPFTGMINQCCSAIDGAGRLHVVYYGDDTDGFTNYHHLWRDTGGRWRCDALSSRKHQVVMSGGGFLQLPLSRPDIVIDRMGRVYVIYRGDLTGEKLVAQRLDPPDYRPPGAFFLLWDQSLEFAEPIIDRIRWERDGILSIFLLPSDQAQFDRPQPNRVSPAVLADFRLD